MEGNYQIAGFYCDERNLLENTTQAHQPQNPLLQPHPPTQQHQPPEQHQPPQPHQQHAAHYPLDLPIPYFTAPPLRQFQQELRTCPPAPRHATQMVNSVYQNTGPGHSDSDVSQEVHQHPVLTLGGHRVKSTSQSLSYAPPITTNDEVVEKTNQLMASQDPIVDLGITQSNSTQHKTLERNVQPIKSHDFVKQRTVVSSESNGKSIMCHQHIVERCEKGQTNTTTAPDQTGIASAHSIQRNSQREQSQASSRQSSIAQDTSGSDHSEEGPLIVAALNLRKIGAIADLPPFLSFRVTSRSKIVGVVAKETIEEGVEFGPYTGDLLDENEGWKRETTWEICVSKRVCHYIDGCENWMSRLRCARNETEKNVEAFQHYGEIYFRTTKVIEPGSELRAFYSDEYWRHVGIKLRLNHLIFNKDVQKFQCNLCGDLFTSAKLVLRHTRYEHKIRSNVKKLATETVKNTMKKRYMSSVNLKPKSRTKRRRQSRMEEVPDDRSRQSRIEEVLDNKCGICDKVFSTIGRLKAHEVFHEYHQGHTCPMCGKRQKNAESWARHMKQHKLVLEARPYKCSECNGRYKSKSGRMNHEHKIHGYPCRVCSERFLQKRDCVEHEKSHEVFLPPHESGEYSVRDLAPDEPKDMLGKWSGYYQRPFKCRFCPSRFNCHKAARKHEQVNHMGEETFKCPQCSRTFPRESLLKEHLVYHKYEHMYKCSFCPRSFASEGALTNHLGEHTGLKPCKCEFCGRGFRNRKNCLSHISRMHRDRPKRFFCSECNKGFSEKYNLKVHEKRHKGIRQFVCQECGRAFTAKFNLTAHINSMHKKERPFSCEICGKKFALNHQYNHHMAKHRLQKEDPTIKM